MEPLLLHLEHILTLDPSARLKLITFGVVAAGALFGTAAANAGVNWSVGINLPGIESPPVYYAPAPVYLQPPPVYYQPAPPVYYQPPPPVYYRSGPAFYGSPPAVYYDDDDRKRYKHHHGRHGVDRDD